MSLACNGQTPMAGSSAGGFVKSFFSTSLLVNVIDNNFQQLDAIFEPFIKVAAGHTAQKHVPMGVYL